MKPIDTMWKKELQTELSEARDRLIQLEEELSRVNGKYNSINAVLKAGLLYTIIRWKYVKSLL